MKESETHIGNGVQRVGVDNDGGRAGLSEKQRKGRGKRRVRLLTQGSVLLSINASQGQACRSPCHQQFSRFPFTERWGGGGTRDRGDGGRGGRE